MFINVLTIACGLALGFVFISAIYFATVFIKRVIYGKKITYTPTRIFTHDNKQFQKIEREEKTKK